MGRTPSRPRAFESAVEHIRADITAHSLPPGDRLPSEHMLAEQFGFSRHGVREAVRVLELQGLVHVRHGYEGGIFVVEPGAVPIRGALRTSLQLGHVGVVGVDELYHARVLFEPTIARLAVERHPDQLATVLAENVARAESLLAEGAQAFGVNLGFHAVLAQAAGNRVLALIMHAVLDLLESLDRLSYEPQRPI